MSEQLTLKLDLYDDTTFSNFCTGKNQQLIHNLQETARCRGEQFIYLWGQRGVGRTHLLQACCHAAHDLRLSPMYLPLGQIEKLNPAILENLEALHLVCVDNIEDIVGRPEWEEAFFHFYNRMRDAGKRLVVAGSLPPNELNIQLNDLVSRLNWGVVFQIQELTDEEKLHAFLMRSKSRGIDMPKNIATYLLTRWRRSLPDLFNALDKIDEASLRDKRKLTLPFVKTVLAEQLVC